MDLSLSSEQVQIQNLAKELAENELAPRAAVVDRDALFPRDNVNKLAELGLLGLTIPGEFGGGRLDPLSVVLCLEQLSKACPSTALVLGDHLDAASIMVAGGGDEAKSRLLPSMARGEKLGTVAISERGSGCNPFNVETAAKAVDDHYVVNGSKVFITSGEQAEVHFVAVRTNPEQPGPGGQSYLFVEKGNPGFSLGESYERMGFRGVSPRELVFEDCRVPKDNLVGGEGGYLGIQLMTGGSIVIGAAAVSLGIAQVAVEASIKYAKERLQVGKQPLTSYQAVKFMLIEMSTAVDVARAMVYQAAAALSGGPGGPPVACFKAKLFASEMALEVTDRALRVHGGTGYCRDLPIERYYRDARGMTLHGIPTELLKDFIGMFML